MTATILVMLPDPVPPGADADAGGGAGPDAPLVWARLPDEPDPPGAPGTAAPGGRVDRPEDLHAALVAAGDGGTTRVRLVAVVPGQAVLCRPVHLVARTERQARAALGFLLEDDLAVEGADLHLAVSAPVDAGSSVGAGDRLAAAVDAGAMAAWMDMLARTGLPVEAVVPDYLALCPAPGELWVADAGDGTVLVGEGAGVAEPVAQGYRVETGLAGALVDETLAAGAPAQAHLLGDAARLVAPSHGVGDTPVVEHEAEALAPFLARRLASRAAPALSLLQGPYAPRGSWREALAPWRPALGLAAAVLVALALSVALEAWRLDARAEALHARAGAVLRETFPEVARVVNPRTQMATRVAALRATGPDPAGSYLDLAAMLFESVAEIDGARIERLRYDGTTGSLTAELRFGSFGQIERLRAAVDRRGGALDEGASRQEAGRVIGDITVRRQ
ncbi:type II secretion system protein GspL [Rhodothalassium salexigens]|uniref:type II secretion system protein GspL n=1 Tax=Rhodothalassium salexigens TaxID=1086 RepID=UPI00191222E6|nr:type II secretion system protein GspL [Rhodothalassium salexigens]MBK5911647.1 type II secretion system protein GspL [Rhodothalassium salexigens]MBK5920940.1 type II secretion system protein GspL [Rhodothalassium salexigens]